MHSMTGFGRAEHTTDTLLAKVEINSVNRKQGEVVVQIPRTLASLETDIRKTVLGRVQRGRIHVGITLNQISTDGAPVQVDQAKAQALINAMKQLEQLSGRSLPLTASDFIRANDIIHLDEQDITPEDASKAITPALEAALLSFIKMRKEEGDHMKEDITSRINLLEKETDAIESHAPSVVTHYRNSLHRRLKESGLELDLNDERVLKEIGIFAERCDIAEEITRLRSHFVKFHNYLADTKPVGRSLDFLCQEINREFNTIGSKANDATLAQHVVNCKTELEKAREQVQNIE